MSRRDACLFLLATAIGSAAGGAAAAAPAPFATVDLATEAGLAAVGGEWRVRDAEIVPVEFFAAGADGQPGGAPSRTFDVQPRPGDAGFDGAAWPRVAPAELALRRGGGKLSFVWYRLTLNLPAELGGHPLAGATALFETAVDDAAEVWIDGELRRCPQQQGGSMVAGWNAANRVVAARAVVPGRPIEIAVFGVNGPLSGSPTNYVWIRSAKLELYEGGAESSRPAAVAPACEENLAVDRFDPRLDAVLSRNPKLFLIAEGFSFTEGPVWVPDAPAGSGHLLFSEPNANRIWKWTPTGELTLFRERSGYDGADLSRYRQPGSNGLALDAEGRLTIDQHGNRRVIRIEPDGRETVVAAREGRGRLNSPNDLVYRSDGALYFTDPFFGLPEFGRDPAKELPYQGVYRVREGRVELLTKDLSGPNGIAFSPDERFLYVGDWDDAHKAVVRYPVLPDGRLGPGATFLDLTAEPGEDAIDGVKTDAAGNVYVSGPGGLWIVAADGTRLGRVRTPRHAHNFAWGEDGSVLYLTARDQVYRLPLKARGHAPHLGEALR